MPHSHSVSTALNKISCERITSQLATLLVNGRRIHAGDMFPVGWDADGGRLREFATEELMSRAERLITEWQARPQPKLTVRR